MKKYVIISGFNTSDCNRGTAALSYGSINFCIENGILKKGQEILSIKYIKKFWKKEYNDYTEEYNVEGETWKRKVLHVFFIEKVIYDTLHMLLPFSKFGKHIRNVQSVAAINGGDGFSDIYNTETFLNRLTDIKIAMREEIPLVMLPQTIGPFGKIENETIAHAILKYADKIFVRDDKYIKEIEALGLNCELAKDLSAYMKPEPWNIDIKPGSIGINVSGLCYSNQFRTLSGQFNAYPQIINEIISYFQGMDKTIYLIPHSYNYLTPEEGNDDLYACHCVYKSLKNKKNVQLINKNLTSPQVKYVISKMSFFIGTRMHANFAAIYSGVPVFGLSYSYKFAGAFYANGLDGEKQTYPINNLSINEVHKVIHQIDSFINHEC